MAEPLEVHTVDTDDDENFVDIQPAPQEMEDGGQATVDELLELNLGEPENPQPTFISALLNSREREAYQKLLLDYKDYFAWSYKEMPGLDPSVAEHELSIYSDFKPVKQTQRRMRPELEMQVVAELDKLLDVDFIEPNMYPVWLANIVPVKKKNG